MPTLPLLPYPDIDAALGRRVRLLRHGRGLSRDQLAQQADTTALQILAYEEGRARISASALFRIARALETCPTDIFTPLTRKMKVH
jgi:transcriptional regulator with XRE-family HTH domain